MKTLILIAFMSIFTSCRFPQKEEEKSNKMTPLFKEISPKEITDNAIKLVADDWLLVTAGKKDNFNMMTASWGGLGNLWGEHVAFIFIRPQRYTYQFLENEKYFTITVFEEQYRKILQYCGSQTGREVNKIEETGLTPLETEQGNIYYNQARLVIECEKIYSDMFHKESFVDTEIINNIYETGDFHKMYIGKIVKVLKAEN